jgi:hypothetical protein
VNAKISFSELHCLCMDVDNQLHKQIIYSRNQFTFLETNLVHEDSAYIYFLNMQILCPPSYPKKTSTK